MKFIFKIIFVFTLCLTAIVANVDECKSDLYYANGIMMGDSEEDALEKWEEKMDDLLFPKPEVNAKIATKYISYNKSENFDDDIYESFEQLMSNEWGWKQFSAYYRVYLQTLGMQQLGNQHANDLTKQVTSYKQSIKLGHGVIVIAHSQGNYFTNEAYELLDPWMKPYFKMMGVATPANHVAGFEAGDTTAPYVKFHNDFIKIVITGLSSNRDDPNPNHNGTFSVAAHDFYDSYLTAENTKGEILGFIETKVKEHTTAPSQWETNEEFELNTCDYKITVKHRHDPSIEMAEKVYPFAPAKKLYQVNGEWVKASCSGENILPDWDGKKENECLMIDNPPKEKIIKQLFKRSFYSGYHVVVGGTCNQSRPYSVSIWGSTKEGPSIYLSIRGDTGFTNIYPSQAINLDEDNTSDCKVMLKKTVNETIAQYKGLAKMRMQVPMNFIKARYGQENIEISYEGFTVDSCRHSGYNNWGYLCNFYYAINGYVYY